MKKFRSKPVDPHEVEAFVWDGDGDTANDRIGDGYGKDWEFLSSTSKDIILFVGGHGMNTIARVGDWIVYTPLGGYFVLTPEQFSASYEEIAE